MRTTSHRAAAALAAAAAISLIASACTGSNDSGANDDASKETTITFWHGWSEKNEVKAIQDNIDRFEKAHPNIHVKAVGGITDEKIDQALRARGPKSPDVVSSFTTDNVGKFCSSKAWASLNPFLEKSKIDPAKTFPAAMNEYTQFEGNHCSLPLLGDSFGLYYNKDAFEAAGITAPPKTMSELREVAKKLTKTKGDSYEQLGILPNWHNFQWTTTRAAAQYGATYFDGGKAAMSTNPAFAQMLTDQQKLMNDLGGFQKLEKFRSTFGDEFGAEHPFHTGQVAMQFDGEWREGMATAAGVDFEIGVAPFPVADDQADSYGKGYLSGTIIGMANNSPKKNAAWELIKFMTTDTEAVVSFSNAIHNVPSTFEAMKSPALEITPNFQVFMDIAADAGSTTTPAAVNGGAYQLTLQDFSYDFESGKKTDLAGGLKAVDEQVDKDIEQAR
ncbi:ABC transporter substrate-binding protein [Streptomyces sp. NPDC051940]|uniref:ABC transporter substrate-binding protein n=1 Tax=Streptomyces sp. NPDC051940 TaxID=3155675 RepID=UPI003430D83E